MDIKIAKKNKYKIWLFIFAVFILPTIAISGLSSVVGRFVPNPLGYNLLAFIISLPLIQSCKNSYGDLKGVVLAIKILVIYCAFSFIATSLNTSITDALTVYRYSYMQALNLLMLLPFMFNMKKEEVDYALRSIFKCLIFFIFIYLSNNLVYDWLGVKGKLIESVDGVSMNRSVIGMPLLDPVWTALLITYTIYNVPKAGKYLVLILLSIIITFTRSLLFSTLIIILITILLLNIKNINNIKKSVKITTIIILGIILLLILMPNAINFWIAKLSSTFNEDLKYDTGTFAFRESLIEDAIYAIRYDPLFGLGYVRDVAKGEYSIVMGTDTYIAPILYCEGWLGLILRILPFAVLGLKSVYNIFNKKKHYWLDLIIISSIIAISVNYVQTCAFTNYPLTLGIIILLKIKDNHDRKTQNFGNYSII